MPLTVPAGPTLLPNPQASVSSKKTTSKTTGSTADAQAAADALKNPPGGNKAGKTGIAGVPLGTPVQTGAATTQYTGRELSTNPPVFSKTQYAVEAPYTITMNMSAQGRANLLAQLGRVPNLYAKGQSPTETFAGASNGQFRQQDIDALTQILKLADQSGQDYTTLLNDFVSNPGYASQFFGKVTDTPKAIALTPATALVDDINSKFQDLFDTPVDKKVADAYAKEYNKAELAAKGAGLTATQQNNIFQKYVEQTALGKFAKVKGTVDTADDSQLEQGQLGQVLRTLRGAYADNGMAVSEKQVYQDAIAGIRSSQSLKNKLESIAMHATTAFPALKDWVAKGNTVKQYLDGGGFIDSYSKIYGVPRAQVTVDKFASAFAGQVPLTVKDWEATQWKDPMIKQTQFYQDTKKNDLRAMADAFGINV